MAAIYLVWTLLGLVNLSVWLKQHFLTTDNIESSTPLNLNDYFRGSITARLAYCLNTMLLLLTSRHFSHNTLLCVTQAEEDDGYDPQWEWTDWCREPLSHRPSPDGDERKIYSWVPTGEDVWSTVSDFLFLSRVTESIEPSHSSNLYNYLQRHTVRAHPAVAVATKSSPSTKLLKTRSENAQVSITGSSTRW